MRRIERRCRRSAGTALVALTLLCVSPATAAPKAHGGVDLALTLGAHGATLGVLSCVAADACAGPGGLAPMFLFGVMGTAGGAVLGHRLERPNAQMVTLGGHLGLLTGAMVGRLTEPDDPADWNQAQRRWALWTIAGDVGGLVAGGLLGARVAPESGRVALTTSGVLWGATAGALLHAGSTDAGLPNPTTVWLGAALGGAAAWLAWEELRIGRAQALIIDAAALVGLLAAPLTWAWWDLNYPREDPTRATALAGGLGVLGGAVLAATLVGRHNQADAATAGAWPQVQITPWAGAGLAVTGRW